MSRLVTVVGLLLAMLLVPLVLWKQTGADQRAAAHRAKAAAASASAPAASAAQQ